MIGGGDKAFTILGVEIEQKSDSIFEDFNESNEHPKVNFLILDPHY